MPSDRVAEALENGGELLFHVQEPGGGAVRLIPLQHLERALLAGGKLLSEDRIRVAKRHAGPLTIDLSDLSPHSHRAKGRLEDKLRSHLRKVREAMLTKLARSARRPSKTGSIIATSFRKLAKQDDDVKNQFNEKDLVESLGLEKGSEYWATLWSSLPDEVAPELEDSALSGVSRGVLQADVRVTGAGLISGLNEQARTFAAQRSAELVGMKRDANGNLVENANARWRFRQRLATTCEASSRRRLPRKRQ